MGHTDIVDPNHHRRASRKAVVDKIAARVTSTCEEGERELSLSYLSHISHISLSYPSHISLISLSYLSHIPPSAHRFPGPRPLVLPPSPPHNRCLAKEIKVDQAQPKPSHPL